MDATFLAAFGVVASLVVLLAASDLMVRELTRIGGRLGLSAGALGLVVAIGADSPEISTALVALLSGSQDIGVGVVEGSNIFNLAGLLGLSALVAGPLTVTRSLLVRDGVSNLVLTALAVGLVLAASGQALFAIPMLIATGVYFTLLGREPRSERKPGSVVRPAILAVVAIAFVVGMSTILVNSSVTLIHRLHLADAIIAVFVLPIATSLPNTWAAINLARHHSGDSVVSAAFNSNIINLAFGIAVPSLFTHLHPDTLARVLDGPYLLGMSAAVFVLLFTANCLDRREGAFIVVLYIVFVAVRIVVLQ